MKKIVKRRLKRRMKERPLRQIAIDELAVLKRQVYGFRDMEYFRLRLAFIHEDRLLLPG